jgi:hypothetical protein
VLAPGTAAGTDEVTVEAVVREVVYAGAETRIEAGTENGILLTALLLNSSETTTGVRRGDPVLLCWKRAAVHIIDT